MEHVIKCNEEFMWDIVTEKKKFEVRLNDRNYDEGDLLILQGFDKEKKKYTGKKIVADVTVHGLARLWTLKNYRSNLLITLNRITNEQFRTKATILPNRC